MEPNKHFKFRQVEQYNQFISQTFIFSSFWVNAIEIEILVEIFVDFDDLLSNFLGVRQPNFTIECIGTNIFGYFWKK